MGGQSREAYMSETESDLVEELRREIACLNGVIKNQWKRIAELEEELQVLHTLVGGAGF